MTLVLVALGAAVVSLVVAVTALTDAMQAGRRCDEIEQAVRLAALDYQGKTAKAREKGWDTRRRKAAELAARQLEFGAVKGE